MDERLWLNNDRPLGGPDCPDPPIERGKSHIAFRLRPEEVEQAVLKLTEMGIQPLGFNGEPIDQPIVLAWMPAISVYFQDPDGHSLEFISMLPEKSAPDLGVVTLEAWKNK